MDIRNVRNGDPIPVMNYSDQPYVVKTDDGGWLMAVTTGIGEEGSRGQQITSAKSIERDLSYTDNRSKDVSKGFSICIDAELDKSGVLFSTFDNERKGMNAVFDGEKIVFTMSDARRTCCFYSDKQPLSAKGHHKITIQVDAGPRIVSMITDGRLCDGADERQFGYGWFDRGMISANGAKNIFISDSVKSFELFTEMLTNSQACILQNKHS